MPEPINTNQMLDPSVYKRDKAAGNAHMVKVDSEHVHIFIKRWRPENGETYFQSLPQPVKVGTLIELKAAMQERVDDMQEMIDEANLLIKSSVGSA